VPGEATSAGWPSPAAGESYCFQVRAYRDSAGPSSDWADLWPWMDGWVAPWSSAWVAPWPETWVSAWSAERVETCVEGATGRSRNG
jgi:hypothetical protein